MKEERKGQREETNGYRNPKNKVRDERKAKK